MEKYDVFISFKNTDSDGNLTYESQMAQELYDELSKCGCRVFFSNSTLSQSGNSQYKIEIDDALDDAKALIAVGTSKENLNSSWVRYEWDGFFQDSLNGNSSKQLFSYIYGMSIKELPRTLRNVECFEKGKISLSEICNYICNAVNVDNLSKESEEEVKKAEKHLTNYDHMICSESYLEFILRFSLYKKCNGCKSFDELLQQVGKNGISKMPLKTVKNGYKKDDPVYFKQIIDNAYSDIIRNSSPKSFEQSNNENISTKVILDEFVKYIEDSYPIHRNSTADNHFEEFKECLMRTDSEDVDVQNLYCDLYNRFVLLCSSLFTTKIEKKNNIEPKSLGLSRAILENCRAVYNELKNSRSFDSIFNAKMLPDIVYDAGNAKAEDLKDLVVNNNKVFIGTDGGAGKTFTTMHLMGEMINNNHISVWISSRNIYDREQGYAVINKIFPESEDEAKSSKSLSKLLKEYSINDLFVFLDGFNECTEKDKLRQFVCELLECKQVHLIITSRNDDPNFSDFVKLKMEPLTYAKITDIIGKRTYNKLNPELKELIRRPFFLALAVNNVNLQTITTAAGLIEAEINRVKANFSNTEDYSENEYAVDWLECFAYEDYIKKNRRLSFKKESLKSYGLNYDPQNIDILRQNGLFIISSSGIVSYRHEHYRDYFVAKHILSLLENYDEKETITDIFSHRFSNIVLRFLGELGGTIDNGNILIGALKSLRISPDYVIGTNASATASIIKSLSLSNSNNISGVNFSNLDLTAAEFNNVYTGKASFRKSLIKKNTFLNEAHSSGVRTFEAIRTEYDNECIVSFGNSDMLIIDPVDFAVERKVTFGGSSENGLNTYSMNPYDPPVISASVENSALVVTENGNLYLYTLQDYENHIDCLETKIDNFNSKATGVLSQNSLYYILFEDGTVRTMTSEGSGIKEFIDFKKEISAFCLDKNGDIWAITLGKGNLEISKNGNSISAFELEELLKDCGNVSLAYSEYKGNEFLAFAVSKNDYLYVYDINSHSLQKSEEISETVGKDINYISVRNSDILLSTESGYILKYYYDENAIFKVSGVKTDSQSLSLQKAVFAGDYILACSLNRQILKYTDNFFEISRLIGNYDGLRRVLKISENEILVTTYDGCIIILRKNISDDNYHCTNKTVISGKSWIWSACKYSDNLYLIGNDGKISLLDFDSKEIIDSLKINFRPESFFVMNSIVYCAGGDKVLSFAINDKKIQLSGTKECTDKNFYSLTLLNNKTTVGWSQSDKVSGISYLDNTDKNLLSRKYCGRIRDMVPFGDRYCLVIGTNDGKTNFSVILDVKAKFSEVSNLVGHTSYIVKGAVYKKTDGSFLIATVGNDSILNVYRFTEKTGRLEPELTYKHSNKLFDLFFVSSETIIFTSLSGDLVSFNTVSEKVQVLFKNSSRMLTYGSDFTGVKVYDDELKSVLENFDNSGFEDLTGGNEI